MPEPEAAEARPEVRDPQVNLYASDVAASLRFYREVLGFRETFRTPREGPPAHVELRLGALTLGLAAPEALRRDHGITAGHGPIRVELVLFADDVDGAYGWACSRGAASLTEPHDFGGYLRSSRVADPDGNPVGFVARLPIGTSSDAASPPVFRNHLYNLITADIEPALRFYRDTVGFAETFRVPATGAPDHVEMEMDSLNLAVSTVEALRRDHGLRGGGGPPRGEVVLWVRDLESAFAWFQARGTRPLSPPHDFAGALRGAWVADPDGNPVQLVTRAAPR